MRLARAAFALLLVGCPAPRSPASSAPCRDGTVPLLGACVAPSVGDAWCGPSARMSSSGACVFRACAADEALDLDGSCDPLGSIVRTGPPCPAGAALVVAAHRTACVPAGDACPRGSRLLQGGAAKTSPSGDGRAICAPTAFPRLDASRPIDIGAWAGSVMGRSGGPGSPETCRALAQRPDLFGLAPGQSLSVRLSLRIFVPDEDLSRVYAEVRTEPALPPSADALARAAVSSSLEALRGVGSGSAGQGPRQEDRPGGAGEATAGVVDLRLACDVKSF